MMYRTSFSCNVVELLLVCLVCYSDVPVQLHRNRFQGIVPTSAAAAELPPVWLGLTRKNLAAEEHFSILYIICLIDYIDMNNVSYYSYICTELQCLFCPLQRSAARRRPVQPRSLSATSARLAEPSWEPIWRRWCSCTSGYKAPGPLTTAVAAVAAMA